MSENKITSGKITGLKLDVEKVSKAGKEYKAHVLKVDETIFTVSTRSPAAAYIAKLEIGDEVEVTQGGEYNSVIKVFSKKYRKSGGSSSSPYSGYGKSTDKPAYKDNTQGMIKGNSVSNGVLLAIARHGAKTTKEQIEAAAREILEVHKRLDSEEASKSEPVKSKKEEVISDSDEFDDDISF